jgi:hypothetical protein
LGILTPTRFAAPDIHPTTPVIAPVSNTPAMATPTIVQPQPNTQHFRLLNFFMELIYDNSLIPVF